MAKTVCGPRLGHINRVILEYPFKKSKYYYVCLIWVHVSIFVDLHCVFINCVQIYVITPHTAARYMHKEAEMTRELFKDIH